ncbi:MAG: hypothetical protein GXP55_22930 [Deltaproteobacteria bacterium]|nr:hypothetical protein [Deltaproteobacteria bacterium]
MKYLTLALLGLLATGCFADSFTPAYDPCLSSSECEALLTCTPMSVDYGSYVASDAMCTQGCSSDANCPLTFAGYEGACFSISGGPAICYERCDTDSDCASGFGCTDTVGGALDAICLPI